MNSLTILEKGKNIYIHNVPDPSIDCFNQCEYLPRENNSLSNKVDW